MSIRAVLSEPLLLAFAITKSHELAGDIFLVKIFKKL